MALLSGDFGKTLTSTTAYKPGQGTWARMGTLAVMLLTILAAGYSYSRITVQSGPLMKYALPAVFGAVLGWTMYRLIHWPRYADFLITTESEMNKVSWPSWQEVKISTIVVLILTVFLAIFLSSVDWLWQLLLYSIKILEFRSSFLGDSG